MRAEDRKVETADREDEPGDGIHRVWEGRVRVRARATAKPEAVCTGIYGILVLAHPMLRARTGRLRGELRPR